MAILDELRATPSKNKRAHAFLDIYQLIGLTQDNINGYIHVHHRTKTMTYKTGATKLTNAKPNVQHNNSFLSLIDTSALLDEVLSPAASWVISTPFVAPLERNGSPVYWRIPARSTGGFLTMILQYYSSVSLADDELYNLLLWMMAHNRARRNPKQPQSIKEEEDEMEGEGEDEEEEDSEKAGEEDEEEEDAKESENRPKKKVKMSPTGSRRSGGGGGGGAGPGGGSGKGGGGSGGPGGGAGAGGGSGKGGGGKDKGGKGGGAGESRGGSRDSGGGRSLRSGRGGGSRTTQNTQTVRRTYTSSRSRGLPLAPVPTPDCKIKPTHQEDTFFDSNWTANRIINYYTGQYPEAPWISTNRRKTTAELLCSIHRPGRQNDETNNVEESRSAFPVLSSASFTAALDKQFRVTVSETSGRPYAHFEVQMKQLYELSRQLSTVVNIKNRFLLASPRHEFLVSDHAALLVLGNLRVLFDCVQSKCTSLQMDWWRTLDRYPKCTERMLTLLMEEVRNRPSEQWNRLRPITFHDFSTLGVARWVNDEILNYFIAKWSRQSCTVLGFSTYFACQILFQDSTCVNPRTILGAEEEDQAVRFIKRRMKVLDIESWDSVFIPIHEGSSHWYSAYIDFRLKKIEIYDSLQEICLLNRQKPVPQRKNTNLMIPNAWDCGIHTLWHLQHVLEFRGVNLGKGCSSARLSFRDNMVGKRFQLAQELLQDVCKRRFSRLQDCHAHINQKRDSKHHAHRQRQARDLQTHFRDTAEAVHLAHSQSRVAASHLRNNLERDILAKYPAAVVKSFQVDPDALDDSEDSLPSVDVDMDEAGDILCEAEELDSEERRVEDAFEQIIDGAAREVWGVGLDDIDTKFDFLPDSEPSKEGPGSYAETPSRGPMHRSLADDDDQQCIWQWHPTAGEVLRKEPMVYRRWKNIFSSAGGENVSCYEPFTSRLEWEVAQWAVKEKISQKSFDRLLKIPEVKDRLGLSFNNARSMLDKVDGIPERCGRWFTKQLSFKDRPEERFTIRHRDPIEAIKALWGDPSFSKDLHLEKDPWPG
ncbi:hypothetical protein D9757_009835 [Collybiopsis confluens]|uniref:Ubiquitin-like protease family profile domain-containing protein n=1 Tax=Collybiopsis confluens TaxID=2823264 RepID=A0A8H5H722_9AGAR|nr:hypothetical protein D9757_009835 [Collybiopsis confluens]